MADISVTAASVQKGTGAVPVTGVAGAAITAGQPLYKDTANADVMKPADANLSSLGATVSGIALHAAEIGQPIQYQTAGLITFNAVLTAGKVYVLSATPGGIAPVADLTTGWRTSVLMVALSTTSAYLLLYNSDTANA